MVNGSELQPERDTLNSIILLLYISYCFHLGLLFYSCNFVHSLLNNRLIKYLTVKHNYVGIDSTTRNKNMMTLILIIASNSALFITYYYKSCNLS